MSIQAGLAKDNIGQIIHGDKNVMIRDVVGGEVNIYQEATYFEALARPVSRGPKPFLELLDRMSEASAAAGDLAREEVVEFYGSYGSGKTSLLRSLAHHPEMHYFPDGMVYCRVRRRTVDDLLLEMFDAFMLRSLSCKPTEMQIRNYLADTRALIFLDDVALDGETEPLTRDDIDQLRADLPGCAFLLASQQRVLWGEGQSYEVLGLPVDDALLLLDSKLKEKLKPEERDPARAMCTALEGHPLRIIQAAEQINRARQQINHIIMLVVQGAPGVALEREVVSTASLNEKRAMRLLAAVGFAPLGQEHAAALTGMPDIPRVLQGLVERGLAEAVGNQFPLENQFSLAGNLLKTIETGWDLAGVRAHMLEYFLNWLKSQPGRAAAVIDNLPALQQMLEWAIKDGRWEKAFELSRLMEPSLVLAGLWGAWKQVLDLAHQAAKFLNLDSGTGWTLHEMGTRNLLLGNRYRAKDQLEQALEIRLRVGDQAGAAVTRHNLNLLVPPPPPPEPPKRTQLDFSHELDGILVPVEKTAETTSEATPGWLLAALGGAVSLFAFLGLLGLFLIFGLPPNLPIYTPIPTKLDPRATVEETAGIPIPETGGTETVTPSPDSSVTLTGPTVTLTPSPSSTFTSTFTFTPSATTCFLQVRGWEPYRVGLNDTLFSLGQQRGVSVQSILQRNCLPADQVLEAGTIIFLPPLPQLLPSTSTITPSVTLTLTTQPSLTITPSTPTAPIITPSITITTAPANLRFENVSANMNCPGCVLLSFAMLNDGETLADNVSVNVMITSAGDQIDQTIVAPRSFTGPSDAWFPDIQVQLPPKAADRAQITLIVDPGNEVTESDEGDNIAVIDVDVPLRQPNLTVVINSVNPNDCSGCLWVSYTVSNTGDAPAQNVFVSGSVSSAGLTESSVLPGIDFIAQGETIPFQSFQMALPNDTGSFAAVVIVVDPNNLIPEKSKADNTAQRDTNLPRPSTPTTAPVVIDTPSPVPVTKEPVITPTTPDPVLN